MSRFSRQNLDAIEVEQQKTPYGNHIHQTDLILQVEKHRKGLPDGYRNALETDLKINVIALINSIFNQL